MNVEMLGFFGWERKRIRGREEKGRNAGEVPVYQQLTRRAAGFLGKGVGRFC